MGRIAVLGSANMDLVVRQPRLPHAGETMFGSSFDSVPGGKGLNQAIAASRAGARVAFMGAIGRDAFGAQLRECLEENGVSTRRSPAAYSPRTMASRMKFATC